MKFDESVFKLVLSRHSVRTFIDRKIPEERLNRLLEEIRPIKSPFKGGLRIEIVEDKKGLDKREEKLGTYGIIKGTRYFLACAVKEDSEALYKLGYVLEKAVLYFLNCGLGTCWMGGTFSRSTFARKADLREDEFLPIIIPFGYANVNKSIRDKIVRLAASSSKRKPWNELFFKDSLETPLLPEDSREYKPMLEAVRLAPSASNKQPWRVIKRDDNFEFYLNPTRGYGEKLGYNIQEIDIGIAMAHFDLIACENEIEGSWDIVLKDCGDTEMIHVATWRRQGAY